MPKETYRSVNIGRSLDSPQFVDLQNPDNLNPTPSTPNHVRQARSSWIPHLQFKGVKSVAGGGVCGGRAIGGG